MISARKRCIFCGNPPKSKNLEHILPDWLIKHTGDPKRTVYHGMHFGSSPAEMRPKIFSFNKFRFPACEECNQRWSQLENEAKSAILAIENENSVDEIQLNSLLDWMDKVRVGLWISRQLDGSTIASVEPKFYIQQRVGASDRLLHIVKGERSLGLTTIGVGGAIFGFMPSVFALRINGTIFFNASSLGLFGHRLGFPIIRDVRRRVAGNTTYGVLVSGGTGKIKPPISQLKFPLRSLRIYQPMYKHMHRNQDWIQHYKTDFVVENSIDWENGNGGIFQQNGDVIKRINKIEGSDYEQSYAYNNDIPHKILSTVELWQRQLSRSGVRGDIDSPERKSNYAKVLASARKFDATLGK